MIVQKPLPEDTHRALLINIEPIVKCEHPIEKVNFKQFGTFSTDYYQCECGARMKPKQFEEIK